MVKYIQNKVYERLEELPVLKAIIELLENEGLVFEHLNRYIRNGANIPFEYLNLDEVIFFNDSIEVGLERIFRSKTAPRRPVYPIDPELFFNLKSINKEEFNVLKELMNHIIFLYDNKKILYGWRRTVSKVVVTDQQAKKLLTTINPNWELKLLFQPIKREDSKNILFSEIKKIVHNKVHQNNLADRLRMVAEDAVKRQKQLQY